MHFDTYVILRCCMFSPYDNDGGGGDDDDDVHIADDTKVSFLILFNSPLENV